MHRSAANQYLHALWLSLVKFAPFHYSLVEQVLLANFFNMLYF